MYYTININSFLSYIEKDTVEYMIGRQESEMREGDDGYFLCIQYTCESHQIHVYQ